MNLRVTCTREEYIALKDLLWGKYQNYINSISEFYPNRGLTNVGRVYIDLKKEIRWLSLVYEEKGSFIE